jgi:two-component system, OmpR family, sensor histidine kinase KdpD
MRFRAQLHRLLRLAGSLGLIAAVTLFYTRFVHVNSTTVALTFLLAVLATATWWSLFEAVVGSVIAVLAFNYFFLPPVGTFTIADPQNWIALTAFLVTSVIASQLSTTAKRRTAEAVQRRTEMERLYNLSRALMIVESRQAAVARHVAAQIASAFDVQAVAILDRRSGEIQRSGPEDLPIEEAKLRDAAVQNTEFRDGDVTVLPIRLGGSPIGSLGIVSRSVSDAALHAIANLAAISFERARNLELAGRAEAARQSQELKSTLLDAVAHEFKTPLTSIKAASSALLSGSQPDPATTELLTVISEEADRMNSMVTEAIEMARIEAGELRINREPHQSAELLKSAIRKIEPHLDGRRIELSLGGELPLCSADPALFHTVVLQLLDNALKYSPPNSPVTVSAETQGDCVVFTVADRGQGIPEEEREHVFEKFYRRDKDRRRIPGTGMGLAIAKEIVEAHGGRIWVESTRNGSRFIFSLPVAGVKVPS